MSNNARHEKRLLQSVKPLIKIYGNIIFELAYHRPMKVYPFGFGWNSNFHKLDSFLIDGIIASGHCVPEDEVSS